MDKAIEWGREIVDRILPEGSIKELMRKVIYGYYNYLDALSKMITRAELLGDGSLLVELNVDGGLKFYTQREAVMKDRILKFYKRIQYRYGDAHILANLTGLEYFGSLWLTLREQFLEDVYLKYYSIKDGDTVVDVGAHIGTFAVRAALAAGDSGMVVAIEPERETSRFLERNVWANNLRNVVIVQKAVWSTKDLLELALRGGTGEHTLLHSQDDVEFVKVEADTLDNILMDLGVKKVDFLKVDIEGAEIDAYKGMKKTINDNDLNLAIGAYHKVGGKPTYTTIVPWMKRDGFEVRIRKGIVYGMKKS